MSFTYDDNGNLTSDGVRSYTWDERNQLTAISGGVSAGFGYDGFGRRRSRTVGGVTRGFLYDGLNPVQELAGGSPVANLLTGLGIDEYFTRTDGAGTVSYLTDALGSTVALADGSAAVQTEYTYEPFGGTSVSGTSTGNSFGFTGREDDGTGLYFYRARYYDPRLQRFVAEDPLLFRAGDPNVYAYVANAPTGFTDPLGLQLVNNSRYPWWVKPEKGDKPVECVPPGSAYPDRIDGGASPWSPRPGEVLKVPDFVWILVGGDGVPRVYSPPIWWPSPCEPIRVGSSPLGHTSGRMAETRLYG